MIFKLLIGIIGLGIVVFIHELGHFIAAVLCNIKVETFSVGWGKTLFSFKKNDIEFKLGLFPFGGYCKMKGEYDLKEALEKNKKYIDAEKGSFFAATPIKRIFVAIAGPLANFLAAIFIFFLVTWIGYSFPSFSNKIILESDYPIYGTSQIFPATEAGLETGDKIIAINDTPVKHYRHIQESVTSSADKELLLTIERNGIELTKTITPILNKETGAGRIGVYAWIDPVIGSIEEGSAAAVAGLQPDDLILSLDNTAIEHTIQYSELLHTRPQKIEIGYKRDGQKYSTVLIPHFSGDENPDTGIRFKPEIYHTDHYGFTGSLIKGAEEAVTTTVQTLGGLKMLFRGIDLRNAISGPIRISFYAGEIATQGFARSISDGIVTFFQFLGLLCCILGVMNLLPIPALDGGQILMFVLEGISRKKIPVNLLYRYQLVGMSILLILIVFATFSDVMFFIQQ